MIEEVNEYTAMEAVLELDDVQIACIENITIVVRQRLVSLRRYISVILFTENLDFFVKPCKILL